MSDRRARNWELHNETKDGYEDADMDFSSDSEASIPLAKICSGMPGKGFFQRRLQDFHEGVDFQKY